MVKKQQKTAAPKQAQGRRKAAATASPASPAADTPFAEQVRTSAQQIWSAGLAAFAKAQDQGVAAVGRSTPAQDAVARRMSDLAGEVGSRAGQQWDKLESIFEDRVARALERLGMPAADEVAQLKARVQSLEADIAMLRAAQGGPTRKPAARTASNAVKPAKATQAIKGASAAKAAKPAKGAKRTT